MKSIYQLVPDIQEVLKKKGWLTAELSAHLSLGVARRLGEQHNPDDRKRGLRLSRLGPWCPKALWHSVHTPELAEALPPWAEMKYGFGHMIEAYAITLSMAADHHVAGEQDELSVDGVLGHRDCVIDGAVVDVKSCNGRTFEKIKSGRIGLDDGFGYLDQLDGYVVGSAGDPLVTVKDRGYLLIIHKDLGHMYLYEHRIREDYIRERVRDYKSIVATGEPPQCTCEQVSDGASGNIALGVRASYSAFKHTCFPRLRTYIYSRGPQYFTKVVKVPMYRGVPLQEVDRNGKAVYN